MANPRPRIAVGMHLPANPPPRTARALLWGSRLSGFDSVVVADHFQGFVPRALWDKEFTWTASERGSPHASFDFQVLLGHLAARAGNLRLGVAVTEPVRRHPVLIAQAMMTLAHLTRQAPILGIGSGERENIEPYGLDFDTPVSRLEEALQIIRRCFVSRGPFDFHGEHFRLEHALMDLQPPPGRTPHIWIAAHGPRMLRLTGQYGDGWYPAIVRSPDDYAAKLAIIRRAAQTTGRNPEGITPSFAARVVVAPTEQEARAMLDARSVRYVGLLVPGDVWREFGAAHPFGDEFRGYIDMVPERYSRQDLDEAIELVPVDALAELLVWGTPAQIVQRIRALGHAGLRHVVLGLVSALISRRSALYTLRSARGIVAALKSGA